MPVRSVQFRARGASASVQFIQFSSRTLLALPRTITDLKEVIREEMRAIPRFLCKDVVDNFVLRLKKCAELSGGYLETLPAVRIY